MPMLETARMILRPPEAGDFDAWATMMADEETTRYLGGPQPRPVAWRGFMTMAGAWHLEGHAMFIAIEKATGEWLGRVGPWTPNGWPGTEIGWAFRRQVWGRGLATEGAIAAIDWAVETLGWTDIIHCIDPRNEPSKALARRLGSRLRGPGRMPPPWEEAPVEIWGQTGAEWRTRRGG
jgi:RimJ/RimL family protein N-acetyltransferase